jgi:hypothetical protein
MNIHTSVFIAFTFLVIGTTVLAAPIAEADPLIEYHALPTATPISYNHDSHDKIGASIHSLIFGPDKRAAVSYAEDDWENWQTQWKRQQRERRCNLWNVCVRIYKPEE